MLLIVSRLLENLIEDVENIDPVKEFALAERPCLDFCQLFDELVSITSLEFVD
jgi:hypothetical protein